VGALKVDIEQTFRLASALLRPEKSSQRGKAVWALGLNTRAKIM
jgi:hypothetical protein